MPEIEAETTAKQQCLARWPSLLLTCGICHGLYRVTTGSLLIASGKTARKAWDNALTALNAETDAMYRDAWQRTLEEFGHGIQSASEGSRP